jgi:nitrogen fixation/metabolism regulation signal transduction histidine kinase
LPSFFQSNVRRARFPQRLLLFSKFTRQPYIVVILCTICIIKRINSLTEPVIYCAQYALLKDTKLEQLRVLQMDQTLLAEIFSNVFKNSLESIKSLACFSLSNA